MEIQHRKEPVKQALVIQEDIIMLKILERLVISVGFECRAISSIEKLTPAETSSTYNVVVSDILFDDGISSFDYAFQLREVFLIKHLFIVTKMGQEIIRKNLQDKEGVDGFFEIPFDLDELEKELQKFI